MFSFSYMNRILMHIMSRYNNREMLFSSIKEKLKLERMKNIKYSILIILLAFASSCNFVDPEEFTIRSEDQIAGNWDYIRSLHMTPYSFMPKGYNTISNSWLASASDEAEEVDENKSIQRFNVGNWNQYSNPDDRWEDMYKGIRAAHDFIRLTDTITWKSYRLSDPSKYSDRVYYTKMYRKEMFFLRAFFYFELIKRYGGVPLVTKKLDVQDLDDVKSLQRDSFSDCVDYIVNQCDTAARYLLTTQNSSDYGVPTKGAALALKARTLLYAASDLYNKSGNTDPTLGYTDDNRSERWLKAAEACKEVLDMSPGVYTLNGSYSDLFLLGSAFNKEVIFERRYGFRNSFETLNYSVGFNGGKTGTCPSQNLIDAYEMSDGSAFDWSNPTHSENPYLNRDPRLAMTIVTNNSTFNSRTMEMWNGGLDGPPIDHVTKTGYYLKKHLVENLDLSKDQTAFHQWIFFRLAEFYLNYAEAMNEVYGPDDNGGMELTAREAVNIVRSRSGVNMPEFPLGMTQSNFRERLRNERRVELAFEDHRYWDVRRWGIASSTLGADIKGVNVTKGSDGVMSYEPFTLESRTYSSKMDFYPIPEKEVLKSDGNITQNPGW